MDVSAVLKLFGKWKVSKEQWFDDLSALLGEESFKEAWRDLVLPKAELRARVLFDIPAVREYLVLRRWNEATVAWMLTAVGAASLPAVVRQAMSPQEVDLPRGATMETSLPRVLDLECNHALDAMAELRIDVPQEHVAAAQPPQRALEDPEDAGAGENVHVADDNDEVGQVAAVVPDADALALFRQEMLDIAQQQRAFFDEMLDKQQRLHDARVADLEAQVRQLSLSNSITERERIVDELFPPWRGLDSISSQERTKQSYELTRDVMRTLWMTGAESDEVLRDMVRQALSTLGKQYYLEMCRLEAGDDSKGYKVWLGVVAEHPDVDVVTAPSPLDFDPELKKCIKKVVLQMKKDEAKAKNGKGSSTSSTVVLKAKSESKAATAAAAAAAATVQKALSGAATILPALSTTKTSQGSNDAAKANQCFKCKAYGHFATSCPLKKGGGKGGGSDAKPASSSWSSSAISAGASKAPSK